MNCDVCVPRWSYAPGLGEGRITALSAGTSAEQIIERIVRHARVLCVHQPPCDEAAGFARVVATISVPREVFDEFFNAPNGYRGTYARSPYAGLELNHRFLSALLPAVTEAAALAGSPSIDAVCESMSSPSAKIWLAEVGLHDCPNCIGEWERPTDLAPEITNQIWEQASGLEAAWGRKAPYFTRLKLIGAFLNTRNDEFIPARKRDRAQLLHARGWA